ncbi:MAG: hypothetical protein J6X16_07960 [Bacteroidales bacterium]|nr:hypothetical protein [Bacteroidales bacterium]
MKAFLKKNLTNPWFWTFIVLIIAFFFLLPIMSTDAGNSGDEDGFQWPYAEQIYNFYATGGKDTTCLQNDDMGMHGGFFDQFTYAIVKWFNIEDYSQLRHICNALFGWICILFVGLLAYRLGGWRAGVFAIILLFLSPRFLGHSFNNPKDLIYASMMMAGLYYVFCLVKEYPNPKISTSVKLAIFAALAIVSRFAGYLLFAYLVFFLIIYHIILNKKSSLSKNSFKTIGRYVIFVAAIGLVSFGICIALWPYIMSSPIKTTLKIFTEMSQYNISIRQLFEGSLQWSDVLPWYYTPKYIFMTIPIAVIIGVILFFVLCWIKKEDRFWAFFVFFTFFFPVFWIVYTHANVYGGWRHALFAYPPMVAAAGWGFDALVKWIEKKIGMETCGQKETKDDKDSNNGRDAINRVSIKGIIVNVASVIVLLVLLIGPIRHIIANHPYEYVYFNELEGGIDKAYGNYELDYYYHSTREASEWIIANAEPNADGSKIKVATWHIASVNYFFRKDTARFAPLFCRWYEKGNNDWDYAIFTITGMAPEQIKHATAFPPVDCIKTIDVDGKPICLILKRRSKVDMLGNQYKSKNQVDSAIICFKEALAINPYNEAALNNIIECYLMKGQLDSAKTYIDHELTFMPKYETANYFLAHYYMTKGEMDKAIETCKFIIDCNFKFTSAYHLMCNIYLRQNDIKNAEKALSQLIDHDQLDNAGVQQLINIYKADGLDDRGAYRKLYKKIAKSLESRGKKEEAQTYWDLYKQLR